MYEDTWRTPELQNPFFAMKFPLSLDSVFTGMTG